MQLKEQMATHELVQEEEALLISSAAQLEAISGVASGRRLSQGGGSPAAIAARPASRSARSASLTEATRTWTWYSSTGWPLAVDGS